MMEDFLGVDYTMDKIRDEIGVQPYGAEVPLMQPLVGQSNKCYRK
jgi:hypothetical protein